MTRPMITPSFFAGWGGLLARLLARLLFGVPDVIGSGRLGSPAVALAVAVAVAVGVAVAAAAAFSAR